MSASDLACSMRNAASASFRWWAKDASTVKATAPVPITLSASIVVVNHAGTSTSGKTSSPTMPKTTNVTTNATNHPIARRTSRKTRAPSGARKPHSATPPEGRNPPDSICPSAVMTMTSRSWTTRNGMKRLVFAKNTNDATEMAK